MRRPEIKIIKGVPVPPDHSRGKPPKSKARLTVESMKVGDMVEARVGDFQRIRVWMELAGYVATSRRMEDGIVRVWRIE